MRLCRFINGGFCCHKITGQWKGCVSAWYDKDGCLLDAEQIPHPFGPSRPVKRNGPMWRQLQLIGIRYKHIPVE